MARKKSLYLYNPDTCSYEKVAFSWNAFFQKLGLWAGMGGAVALVTYVLFVTVFVDYKEEALQAENQGLKEQIMGLDHRLMAHTDVLEDLRSRDNGVYLPIIGDKGISRSAWEGGRGGSADILSHRLTPSRMVQERLTTMQHQIGLLSRSFAKILAQAHLKDEELANIPSISPVDGNMISGFGVRVHPITRRHKMHEGLDFACGVGTPLYATGNAVVESADTSRRGYGNCINLDHQNGYKTKFAHLSRILVKPGQKVNRGDLIGYSGNTGHSTGPHLHYEVSYQGVKIDPLDFFYEDLSPEKFNSLVSGHSGEAVADKDAFKEKLNQAVPMD